MISTRKVPFKDLEIDSAGKMRASFNRLNGTVASRAGGSAEDRGRLSLQPPSEAFPKLTVLAAERVFAAQSKAQLACPDGGSCGLLVCHNYSSGMATVRICVLTRTPSTPPSPWCHGALQKALTPLKHISWHLQSLPGEHKLLVPSTQTSATPQHEP